MPAPVEPASACNISIPANLTVASNPGQNGAIVNYPAPTVTGADCGAVTCTPASGSFFPVGTTLVICSASGDPGSRGPATVHVLDIEPPAIGPVPSPAGDTDPGRAFGTLSLLAPTVTDNAPQPKVFCDRPFAASPFAIGATTVTCTAVDASGNTSTRTGAPTVTDREPPTVIAPSRVDASAAQAAGTAVNYGAVRALDNSGPVAAAQCTPPSGSTFPVGITPVSCTATDPSGNAGNASFGVVVSLAGGAAPAPAVQLVAANPSRFGTRQSSRLRYVLNVAGRVTIRVQRCTGKGRKPCSKLTTVRTLRDDGAAGLNSVALAGSGLTRAPHRARFTVTDDRGRISKPLTAGFTVTR
jgi:hypothetical protein